MTETTEQVKNVPNPTGKGGFQDHPELRNPGGWKKEDSISYQYNLLVRLTVEEFKAWVKKYPEDTRTMAQEIAHRAILRAIKSLKDLQEITDRTEGKAPQTVIHDGGFFSKDKIEFEIIDPATIKTDESIIEETTTSTPTTG